MSEVVGVSFRRAGKTHLYLCGDIEVAVGDAVIAETKRGLEVGRVVKGRHHVSEDELDGPPRKLKRVATKGDLDKQEANRQRAVEALEICAGKIKQHDLPMRLIDAEYTFDRSRITFYFTSETRVDFRQLLRDLYAAFKTRIQLLQIGVRDEAKMLGGIGPCGRQLCCCSFLRSFDPVAIKMAKTQGLSLNPSKISGVCGRLMCCLRYESDWYAEVRETLPRVGGYVRTPHGTGKVTDVNVLKRTLMVRIEGATRVEVPANEAAEATEQEAGQPPARERAASEAVTEPGDQRGRAARKPARAAASKEQTTQTAADSSRPRRRDRRRSRRSRRRGPRTEFRDKRSRGGGGKPKTS